MLKPRISICCDDGELWFSLEHTLRAIARITPGMGEREALAATPQAALVRVTPDDPQLELTASITGRRVPVVAIGPAASPELVRAAQSAGAREFVLESDLYGVRRALLDALGASRPKSILLALAPLLTVPVAFLLPFAFDFTLLLPLAAVARTLWLLHRARAPLWLLAATLVAMVAGALATAFVLLSVLMGVTQPSMAEGGLQFRGAFAFAYLIAAPVAFTATGVAGVLFGHRRLTSSRCGTVGTP